MGIPTVPRRNEADYLTRTLETLLQELPSDSTDPLYARVRVLVMNNRPGNHSVFYAVRLRRLRGVGCVDAATGTGHVYPLPDAPVHTCATPLSVQLRRLGQSAQSSQPGSLGEKAYEACVRGGVFVAMAAASLCPWRRPPWVAFKVCGALMLVSLRPRTNHECAAGQRRPPLGQTPGCNTHYETTWVPSRAPTACCAPMR